MKTITKNYTVYNFDELGAEVRQQLVNDFIFSDFEAGQRAVNEYELLDFELAHFLPNSNINLYYDLCGQGCGCTVGGSLNVADILEKVRTQLTEKEYKTISFYSTVCRFWMMPDNRYYTYFHLTADNMLNDLFFDLELNNIRGIDETTLAKFCRLSVEWLGLFCSKAFEILSNVYFLSDDSALAWAADDAAEVLRNNYFFSDGRIFAEQ